MTTARKQIKQLMRDKPRDYEVIPLDASVVRDDEPLVIYGTFLGIDEDTSDVDFYIRLDEKTDPQLNLSQKKYLQHPFWRLFITNASGTGTLKLAIGRAGFFFVPESVAEFLGLTDTPAAYGAGDAGKAAVVKATEDGLEFAAPTPAAHTLASHSTKAHSELTGVSAAQHHAKYTDAEAKAIKLDDFTAPDDNTDLDASTTKHGLLKKLDNDDTHFLDGKGAWAAPPSFDIFDKFREFLPWISLDAFTTGGDQTGTWEVTAQGPAVYLKTDNQLNDDAWIYSTNYWDALVAVGKTTTVEMPITTTDVKNGTCWIRMGNTVADPPSETAIHFGWKLINGDLYASNGTALGQTITDTGVNCLITYRYVLKIVLEEGVSAKFYVDNVLKATHTTNLPGGGSIWFYIHAHIRTTTTATHDLKVGRILMERTY